MSAQPTVSVLTPSYQYASFLGDTLASVAGQARLEEHIVFDGGSTDGTVELLAEQPNGKLFWKSAPDDGQSDALNHALDHAGGDWIGWLNADEFYLPGALEAAMQVASATGADVVVGSSVFVDETGHLIRLLETHPYSHRVLKYYGCYLLSSSVFIRRAVLPAEPWDVQLRTVMDWDLFLRLASTGARFASTRRPMSAFRVHRAAGHGDADAPGAPRASTRANPLRHQHPLDAARARYRRARRATRRGRQLRSRASHPAGLRRRRHALVRALRLARGRRTRPGGREMSATVPRSFVTTSWDDGNPLDLRVAELLADAGLRGTFYIPIEWDQHPILDGSGMRRLIDLGMEVGAHTYTHVDATSIPPEQLRRELRESRDVLEQRIGAPVTAFCYPKGRFRKRLRAMLIEEGYRTARTTQSLRCEVDFDPLYMPVTCQLFPHGRLRLASHALKESNGRGLVNWCNGLGMSSNLEALMQRAAALVAQQGGAVHVWGHSWELEQFDLWPVLQRFVKIVAEHPELRPVTNSQLVAERDR